VGLVAPALVLLHWCVWRRATAPLVIGPLTHGVLGGYPSLLGFGLGNGVLAAALWMSLREAREGSHSARRRRLAAAVALLVTLWGGAFAVVNASYWESLARHGSHRGAAVDSLVVWLDHPLYYLGLSVCVGGPVLLGQVAASAGRAAARRQVCALSAGLVLTIVGTSEAYRAMYFHVRPIYALHFVVRLASYGAALALIVWWVYRGSGRRGLERGSANAPSLPAK